MNGRQRLPDRRQNTSRDFEWKNTSWTVTVGWDGQSQVKEIFLTGAKSGTDLEVGAEDACLLVSRLLQRGDNVSDMANTLLRLRPMPIDDCDTGAVVPSLIATAIAMAADIEAEDGPGLVDVGGRSIAEVSNVR